MFEFFSCHSSKLSKEFLNLGVLASFGVIRWRVFVSIFGVHIIQFGVYQVAHYLIMTIGSS
jgi:hypothetical protein